MWVLPASVPGTFLFNDKLVQGSRHQRHLPQHEQSVEVVVTMFKNLKLFFFVCVLPDGHLHK